GVPLRPSGFWNEQLAAALLVGRRSDQQQQQQQQVQQQYSSEIAMDEMRHDPATLLARLGNSARGPPVALVLGNYNLSPSQQQQLSSLANGQIYSWPLHAQVGVDGGATAAGSANTGLYEADFVSGLMRQGRAYKPKIMATARGFGKRHQTINFADLMASANPTVVAHHAGLSGNGVSSKYSEWFNHALNRYPSLGDGQITEDERYQSL
ncbi:hypothetical protein GZH46_01713, partial [Fragariocoptes setiger]